MSKLFINIMRGFPEFAEITGREELFPKIMKSVAGGIDKTECKRFDGDIYVIKADNARRAANNLFKLFYDSDSGEEKGNAVVDCRRCERGGIKYSDYLFAYKKRDFDETIEKDQSEQANEKNFRSLLNEYIIKFKPKEISKKKNLWLYIRPQGRFIAVKKSGDKSFNYDLSANEQTLFDFLCFIEINAFRQFVNEVKDFNYKEKPLILVNFIGFLDESFDYISFLQKQKLNRKIILIDELYVPKRSHLISYNKGEQKRKR